MRAFIAIDIPDAIRTALGREQETFRAAMQRTSRHHEEARWTRPEGIHLTLKFLGEISDAKVKEVIEALAQIEPFKKFLVTVNGFGFFPDARRPRVFWAGLESPNDLSQLAQKVEDRMAKLVFARETRPFSPHLTLARFKRPHPQPALESLLRREENQSLGRFEVSEFFLFESKLYGKGGHPEYRKVARFPR